MASLDGAMLYTLERWLATDVVPHVLELEHADEYPRVMVEQMPCAPRRPSTAGALRSRSRDGQAGGLRGGAGERH